METRIKIGDRVIFAVNNFFTGYCDIHMEGVVKEIFANRYGVVTNNGGRFNITHEQIVK